MMSKQVSRAQIMAELNALLPIESVEPPGDGVEYGRLTLAELGLSSLQVIQFATAMESAFQIELDPADFLGLMDTPFEGICKMVQAKR
jgi:acyl carrier protein